jgi:protein O-mannosyl-transferase
VVLLLERAAVPHQDVRVPRLAAALAAFAVLLVGFQAYLGTWHGQYLFDDHPAIVGNRALQEADWLGAAFGGKHQPLANRPLTTLSLVADAWLFGPGPFGNHVVALLLHLANALLLFTLVARTLQAPRLAAVWPAARRTTFAFAVAAVWVAHPLTVDAVAYATQRSTLLFSMALLAALWCTARARCSARPVRWHGVAVAALALGMAAKEDLVVGPLLVYWYDRVFWRTGERRLVRPFHAALAAAWVVLAVCVTLGPHNPTVGYATGQPVSAFEWLLTQAPVVVHYLRLVVWPSPLRGAYDWDIERSLGPVLAEGVIVVLLLVVAVGAMRRVPWLGFLFGVFFLLLAPTSSVMPIVTEIVAERRMYLPMLVVIVPAMLGLTWLLRRAAPIALATAAVVLAIGLSGLTRGRVAVYRDEPTFWADAHEKRNPESRSFLAAQILGNHGLMLFQNGRAEESYEWFDLAMQCDHPTALERVHHAVSLQHRGRGDEAIRLLREVVAAAPQHAEALGTLGTVLLQEYEKDAQRRPGDARLREAEAVLQRAVTIEPGRAAWWNTLGYLCKVQSRFADAEIAYRMAIEATKDLSKARIEPFLFRAEVLERLGREAEIPPMFERLLRARPRDVDLRLHLARVDVRRQDWPRVAARLREILAIAPGHAEASAMLAEVERRLAK